MNRMAASLIAGLLLTSCMRESPTIDASRASSPRAQASKPTNAATSTGRGAGTGSVVESHAEFAKRIRVACSGRGVDLDCTAGTPENGDIYDVELMPDCGAYGFFGGVSNRAGAELRNALPPNDDGTLAVLGNGQLVCIQAIGRAGQDPAYFYAAAVPSAEVARCRDNKLCALYGDRPVQRWNLDTGACTLAPRNRPAAACPQGWVRRDDIEDFPNGM